MRLILSTPSSSPDPGAVREFLRLATLSDCPGGGVWVATHNDRMLTAVLSIVSPGRTMLVFPPANIPGSFHEQVVHRMVQHVCQEGKASGIHLAQSLLDIHDPKVHALLEACAFKRLAELLYLQATFSRQVTPPALAAGLRWQTYSPQSHDLFARTILASYQQSLDCPALNGLRHIDDIMAGHRATGQFDPRMWFALCDGEEALGVLLLSPIATSDVMELVYLGIPPAHRGRGLGDLFMRQAAAAAYTSKHPRLSLAVDSINLPAMKLYWRHGMQAVGRKVALLRDLRRGEMTNAEARMSKE